MLVTIATGQNTPKNFSKKKFLENFFFEQKKNLAGKNYRFSTLAPRPPGDMYYIAKLVAGLVHIPPPVTIRLYLEVVGKLYV